VDCDALIAQVQNQDPHGLVLKDVYKANEGEPAEQTSKQHAKKDLPKSNG